MSRSFKKNPVDTCAKSKYAKKFANKRVRKQEEISNGSNYKKYYNSWDICDYKEWLVGKVSEFSEFLKKRLRK